MMMNVCDKFVIGQCEVYVDFFYWCEWQNSLQESVVYYIINYVWLSYICLDFRGNLYYIILSYFVGVCGGIECFFIKEFKILSCGCVGQVDVCIISIRIEVNFFGVVVVFDVLCWVGLNLNF